MGSEGGDMDARDLDEGTRIIVHRVMELNPVIEAFTNVHVGNFLIIFWW